VIFKDSSAINCIIAQHKKVSFPLILTCHPLVLEQKTVAEVSKMLLEGRENWRKEDNRFPWPGSKLRRPVAFCCNNFNCVSTLQVLKWNWLSSADNYPGVSCRHHPSRLSRCILDSLLQFICCSISPHSDKTRWTATQERRGTCRADRQATYQFMCKRRRQNLNMSIKATLSVWITWQWKCAPLTS
jgi:hypothetical protein